MNSRMLGGILLIVGTTIGGGMLALPVVMAQGGLIGSIILLVASWVVMTFSAFLILESNLWFPPNSNFIFMVKKTLGIPGAIVAWFCYLLLFYCLLAAYIAGGSDVFHGLISAAGFETSNAIDAILFCLILGSIVYLGIRLIDHCNRWLMLLKLGSCLLLVAFIIPHVKLARIDTLHVKYLIPAVTVVMTSFGFSNIIPTLRVYFNNDVQTLRKVILIGSLIPLAAYIIWVAVILGGIPYAGEFGLESLKSDHSTLALTQALIHHSNNASVTVFTRIFTSVCMITSFLGVALCLVDFLADGLSMPKIGVRKLVLHLITFLPPLIIAIVLPAVFIGGLRYAGILLSVLLIIIPALVVWRGRYHLNISENYRVMGGKSSLVLIIIAALVVIGQGLLFP